MEIAAHPVHFISCRTKRLSICCQNTGGSDMLGGETRGLKHILAYKPPSCMGFTIVHQHCTPLATPSTWKQHQTMAHCYLLLPPGKNLSKLLVPLSMFAGHQMFCWEGEGLSNIQVCLFWRQKNRVPTKIRKQNSMTFPWLICFFPWLPFSHGFRYGYDCVSQQAWQTQTRMLPQPWKEAIPWLFHDFWEIFIFQDFSMTFHDNIFFQDFPWPWEPWKKQKQNKTPPLHIKWLAPYSIHSIKRPKWGRHQHCQNLPTACHTVPPCQTGSSITETCQGSCTVRHTHSASQQILDFC